MKDFGHWKNYIHDSTGQGDRYMRGLSSATTPTSVDVKNQYAYFAGKNGVEYFTTLDTCTCIDFDNRGKPCKHIYRLAAELSLIDGNIESGINKNTLQDWFDTLSDETIKVLLEILHHNIYSGKNFFLIAFNNPILFLLNTGYFQVIQEDYSFYADKMEVADLRKALFSCELSSHPKPSCQKKTMIAWIKQMESENIKELEEHYFILSLTNAGYSERQKIYRLCAKYERDKYGYDFYSESEYFDIHTDTENNELFTVGNSIATAKKSDDNISDKRADTTTSKSTSSPKYSFDEKEPKNWLKAIDISISILLLLLGVIFLFGEFLVLGIILIFSSWYVFTANKRYEQKFKDKFLKNL